MDAETQYENEIRAILVDYAKDRNLVRDLVQYVADTVSDACQSTLENKAYDYVMSNPPDRGP